MKILRVLWLVIAIIMLFPIIVLLETIVMAVSIYTAIELNQTLKWAVNNWLGWLKRGIDMNIDFVKNGL